VRVPISWLLDYVTLERPDARDIAERLTLAGLKVEHVEVTGEGIDNVVVARVLDIEELSGFKKPIRYVGLTDGKDERHVICGATNFAVGDLVAYARPPALLPGDFRVEKRPAYGHESDGMICSARELGLGDDHAGIIVLGRDDDPAFPLGAAVVDVLGLRDTVLELSVNPDRGYALSMRGVAREVATAYRAEFRDPATLDVPPAGGDGYAVRIDDVAGCRRYVARVITGVDPSATSPQWLHRRLTLAGMRPISLAVDVTNHVMLDLGQPLHAFDRGRLNGDIVVRRATTGESITTLDNIVRRLDPADLVIADESGAIAIAGVMGGASTEIHAGTRDIVLEAASFDANSVAFTSRRHRLMSEASRRFERGVDEAVADAAAEAAARLLVQHADAEAGPVTDVDHREPREVIRLDPTLPGRLAGVAYSADIVRARLVDVGCDIDGKADLIVVKPPSWRPDLRRPVDLVEEVVRLEGYDALPTTLPRAPAGRGLTRAQRQRRHIGRALAAAGFAEVLSYPFVGPGVADSLMLTADDKRRPTVRVANPVSEEEPFMRASLLPGLLTALARNVGRGFPDVALYELGPVFRWAKPATMPRPDVAVRPDEDVLAAMDAALPVQPLHIAVALAGRWERPGWWGAGRASTWADAVEAARTVAHSIDVTLDIVAGDAAPWHPGRCAAILVGDTVIGHAGELHPRVIEALGLSLRSCAMELALEPVLDAAPEVVPAPLVSAYPPATLDVALVVDAGVPVAEVADALQAGAGPLLEELRLFDVYAGDQVGPGRRSLAFSLRLRAPDRTLTVEEALSVRDAAVGVAAERCGASLRG
jgi:phenylalanyl-tRNA synthetase beta chain